MSHWFRFYADAMRNPKVLRLSDSDFRLWVKLLAVASENDGKIAPADDLKMVLGVRLDYLKGGLKRLISGGLVDPLRHGYEPHGWAKFQYKSDVSTGRVHKHRAKRNVSETPPEAETEVTEANASGGEPPTAADLTKAVWDSGKTILKAAGHDDRQAGSIIGRFRKSYSDSQVLTVLSRCQAEQPSEPVEWLTKALQLEQARCAGSANNGIPGRRTTRESGERVAARFTGGGDRVTDLVPRLSAASGNDP